MGSGRSVTGLGMKVFGVGSSAAMFGVWVPCMGGLLVSFSSSLAVAWMDGKTRRFTSDFPGLALVASLA